MRRSGRSFVVVVISMAGRGGGIFVRVERGGCVLCGLGGRVVRAGCKSQRR